MMPRLTSTLVPTATLCKLVLAMLFGSLGVAEQSATADDRTEQSTEPKVVVNPEPVSYFEQIEPIFRKNCFGCHQGAKQMGQYVMTDFARLVAGGETENVAIVPGKSDESYLVNLISVTDGHAEMPKAPLKPLADVEVELVRRWIDEGAVDDSPEASEPRYSNENPPVYQGPPAAASVDISTDAKTIAVAGFHEVLLLDASDGKVATRLVGLSPRINSVRFSPNGKRLAVVGGTPAVSGEVQIWDVASGKLQLSRQMTFDTLSGGSWSPDGTKLAFGAADNVVRAIDTATGEQVLYQGAHDDWVRDTVFTPDGTHLVSVARDMSCKLTEVDTERFVDNLTSITPGALSGGLNSVAMHPTRNEIVVGGADGIAKVYRVIRQTKRQIGDDANLIRVLPGIKGRIFSVAVSPDGSRIAAAATINDQSQIRVWKYDFDGTLTDELKKILGSRVASRNADQKKKVKAYREAATEQITALDIPGEAVYAIRFGSDNSLAVASAAGNVRRVDSGGNVILKATPFTTDSKRDQKQTRAFDAMRWTKNANSQSDVKRAEISTTQKIASLDVQPSAVHLDSPYAYVQLIVTATLNSGDKVDVTRQAKMNAPAFIASTATKLLRPVSDGKGQLKIRVGALHQTISVTAKGTSDFDVDFISDVNPVLSRLGCNQGTCHGAQKGKNGFKLSLRGYDPIFDLRALTDDLAARRIDPAAPSESVMLRKPLGLIPHQGGVLMDVDDPNHAILQRWIASGSQLDLASEKVESIKVFPLNPVVQSTTATQQVRVVAFYPSGRTRDVTQEAFIESGNTEVAISGKGGVLSAVRRGEAPILARYEGAYAATTLTVMGDRTGYEASEVAAWSKIDELVARKWDRVKVVPSDVCDDATFLRRVHLDLTGLPPTSDQVRNFLADETPTREKRSAVVDTLIGSDDYIEYWTNKWADLLQVNRKFLGVEGATKFRGWIRQAVASNKPYDKFAAEILTATGSNNDTPQASYFKVLRNPEDTMENTTHLFLGIRFNCNKCHDHPFERWTQDNYYQLSAYFAQVELQADPVSKNRKIAGTAVAGAKPLFEKIVDKTEGDIEHARTGEIVPPKFPYDVDVDVKADQTRRQKLATWMTDANNPYFARSYANRLWGYLMGVGLIEPIDDIRAGNPPTNPALLDHLTQEFVASDFDVQTMLRKICNSRTYQLAVETNPLNADDQLNYSHALPRRLPAEVIYDAVHRVTGSDSSIPGVPAGTRAAALSDSGVKLTDGFLQNLGRPARETACECERSSGLELGPVMALISGPTIGSAIADPKNDLETLVKNIPDDGALAEEIFLRSLGRYPSTEELAAFERMSAQIDDDHERIVKRLGHANVNWEDDKNRLEENRLAELDSVTDQIKKRTEAMKPEREKLAAERDARIKTAERALTKLNETIDARIDAFAKKHASHVEWFPLAPKQLTATGNNVLVAQADRSILANGQAKKSLYTINYETSLSKITGFRLEAIGDPALPGGGPGLPKNGNFVVSEIVVTATANAPEAKPTDVIIATGKADFLQGGFTAEATFDGNKAGPSGWAVSGATGVTHWATFKFKTPIENTGGSKLKFELHQNHSAANHTLGRFRISVTTADGDIPLGTPESFAAALAPPKTKRTETGRELLASYLNVTDKPLVDARAAVAAAKKPVPPDAKLMALQNRLKKLSVETQPPAGLVQLRKDVAASEKQLANRRLTAAEDLTWALINSPAFLFNH